MAVKHNLLPRIMQSGLGVVTPSRGLDVLNSILQVNHWHSSQMVISPFDWRKLMSKAHRVFPVNSLAQIPSCTHIEYTDTVANVRKDNACLSQHM